MAWLIQWLEILNLPKYGNQTNWKIWDKIDLEWGKNLMLIWPNWSGKSTILDLVNQSIERARKLLWWVQNDIVNPLRWFSYYFDGSSYLLWDGDYHECFEDMTDEEISKQYDENMLAWFERWVAVSYGEWITNIFDSWYTASRKMLEHALNEYRIDEERSAMNIDEYMNQWWSNAMYSLSIVSAFLDWAELFAYKYDMDVCVVYGNMLMLVKQMHHRLKNDVSMWWYVKPHWWDWLIYSNKLVLDNSQPNWESLWERSKRIVSELKGVQTETIALLDEPTNWVDRKSKQLLRDALFRTPKMVQLIVASHDDTLIDMADDSNDWLICDLDNKTVV